MPKPQVFYNCHSHIADSEAFRITKFDNDLNVEVAYDVSGKSCSCPAFFGNPKKPCKHMRMLQRFLHEHRIDSHWFIDADGKWIELGALADQPQPSAPSDNGSPADFGSASLGSNPSGVAKAATPQGWRRGW